MSTRVMFWELTSSEGQTVGVLPLPGHAGTYTIGRINCDLVVPNDKAVSRAHAQLLWTPTGLSLVDTKSKYGSIVNGVKVDPELPTALSDGDVLAFGASAYTLHLQRVVACASGMAKVEASLFSSAC